MNNQFFEDELRDDLRNVLPALYICLKNKSKYVKIYQLLIFLNLTLGDNNL